MLKLRLHFDAFKIGDEWAAAGTHGGRSFATYFYLPASAPPLYIETHMPSAEDLEWVNAELLPTLQKGLYALCKEKPADPRTWLAEWLLSNKPPPPKLQAGAAAAHQALVDMYKSEDGQAELKALWTELDKDGDGTVSSAEWGKGVAKHWKTMSKFFGGVSQKKVGKLFKELDADHSGDLSWEEFTGAIDSVDAETALGASQQETS